MIAHRVFGGLATLLLFCSNLGAAEMPDAQATARRIDSLMSAAWRKGGVTPAAPASDPEFLRRVYLDLAGRIPELEEVRTFLAETGANKRTKLVDKLLNDNRYHAHFARMWRDLLVPTLAPKGMNFAPLEEWLRERFADNTHYDQITRELVTKNRRSPLGKNGLPPPQALYMQFLGTDPGNVAASMARVFLGLNLECARCHNHPFANWTQDQFWQLAAVFGDVEDTPFRVAWAPRIRIPNTGRTVFAVLPDGTPVKESPGSPQDQLAAWLTRPDNKFFARTAINRVWAIFFSVGLSEPLDDAEEVPGFHAAALEELVRTFVQSGFDIQFLIRTITATRAYQLTTVVSHKSQNTPGAFAAMTVKSLTAEQLADSIAVAIGEERPAERAAILARFAGSNGEMSILQALWWMNGNVMARATMSSRTLLKVANDGKLDTRGRVEELFFVTLSRKPLPVELDRFVKYVESKPADKQVYALGDVFWVLLNTTEFMTCN
jgi:hypothetical protein